MVERKGIRNQGKDSGQTGLTETGKIGLESIRLSSW